ncbi:hypothetical protein J3E64_000402 [Sphingobium sp. OAS761]|uniref:DUF4163 domain-containing protein n=1 Tax=Sphingobium sp. OAS761 TaxID=2817901 RepID=UPI0020A0B79F|nr:DUF4163 domain-containing protein [Sphingobium sp. OAS761]MCP1468735.1 hypothetical protein [Sphingobium sp. OAS761]
MRSGRLAFAAFALLLPGLMLGACVPRDPAGNAADATNNAAAANFADRMAGTPPPAPPAKAFKAEDNSPLLEFSYAYPAQAAAVPALVAKFGAGMKAAKDDAMKMAREDSRSAKESGYPFRAHSLETEWSVAADTPRFLSLRSQTYVYTGGAHGMTGYDTLLWDKTRGRESSTKALMTSPAAFAAAIHDRFCKELDRQRAEKRGEPVVPGDDEFTQCIDPMEQVLVPTSKDGTLIDGVTVVIGPYSAGPYAEGSYEVALPVDAAMLKAIRTDYRDAFAQP